MNVDDSSAGPNARCQDGAPVRGVYVDYSRRQIGTAALRAASAALLAACGVARPAATETRPQSSVPAATLSAWFVDRNTDSDRVLAERIIPSFRERFPQIAVEPAAVNGFPEHLVKLNTAIAAGTMPDLTAMGSANAIYAAQRKLATPLDGRLKQWGVRDDFYSAALQQSSWQGQLLGLPYLVDARAYVWRRDLLSEAGITSLPETWEDGLAVARRLTTIDGDTVTKQGLPLALSARLAFAQLMASMDAPFVRAGKAVFNGAAGLAAAQFFADRGALINPPGMTVPAPSGNDLGLGIAAGAWTSLPSLLRTKSATPEQYTHVTVGKSLTPGGQRYHPPTAAKSLPAALGLPNWYMVAAGSKNNDQAWAFLQHLLSPEQMVAHNETLFQPGTRRSAAKAGYTLEDKVRAMSDLYARYGKQGYKVVDPSRMNPPLESAMQAISQGKVSPREALDDVARQWDQVMQETAFMGWDPLESTCRHASLSIL